MTKGLLYTAPSNQVPDRKNWLGSGFVV